MAATVGSVLTGTDDISTSEEQHGPRATANDAQLGDEYISLTFNESESESESGEESDAEEEDDVDDDDEGEEGSDPNVDDDREMEPE